MARVWRLKEAQDFLLQGHLLAFQHALARLNDDPLHRQQDLLGLLKQALGLLLALLAEYGKYLLTLLHYLLRALDQLLAEVPLLSLFAFSFAPQLPMQGLGYLPRRSQPRTAQLLHVEHLVGNQAFGPLHEAGKHSHAVHEQSTIGGMMKCSSARRWHPAAVRVLW